MPTSQSTSVHIAAPSPLTLHGDLCNVPVGQATHGGPAMRGLGRYVPAAHTSSSHTNLRVTPALLNAITSTHARHARTIFTALHSMSAFTHMRSGAASTYLASSRPSGDPHPASHAKFAASTSPAGELSAHTHTHIQGFMPSTHHSPHGSAHTHTRMLFRNESLLTSARLDTTSRNFDCHSSSLSLACRPSSSTLLHELPPP